MVKYFGRSARPLNPSWSRSCTSRERGPGIDASRRRDRFIGQACRHPVQGGRSQAQLTSPRPPVGPSPPRPGDPFWPPLPLADFRPSGRAASCPRSDEIPDVNFRPEAVPHPSLPCRIPPDRLARCSLSFVPRSHRSRRPGMFPDATRPPPPPHPQPACGRSAGEVRETSSARRSALSSRCAAGHRARAPSERTRVLRCAYPTQSRARARRPLRGGCPLADVVWPCRRGAGPYTIGACIVMARVSMDTSGLYSYGLHSHGLDGYGQRSYALCGYRLCG